VIVGDLNKQRLKQAASFGCKTIDLSESATLTQQLERLTGSGEVDCAIDCVGFEARGCGSDHTKEQPAVVLNQMMTCTKAGGTIGIPGL
jgi:glutathione-independent formaldehyde dehydrogenase